MLVKVQCRDGITPARAYTCWLLRHTTHTLYHSFIPHTSKENFEEEKYVYCYFQNEKRAFPSGGKWWPSNFYAGERLRDWIVVTLDGYVREEALR
jgi:hypothetical protein